MGAFGANYGANFAGFATTVTSEATKTVVAILCVETEVSSNLCVNESIKEDLCV